MRALRLAVAVLAFDGCMLDPVDFTGKSCNSDLDCPEGLRCGRSSRRCEEPAGSDASAAHLDASFDAALPLPDAEVVADLDAQVEPPDAEAPGRDAGGQRDAAAGDSGAAPVDGGAGLDGGPLPATDGGDGGTPRTDATVPGLDAAAPGLDAAAPGLDAAAPGLDASSCGIAPGAPLLQRVGPVAVPAGAAADVTLDLGGANFDRCASVAVNGVPVASTWLGPTQMSAVVPASMVADPGVLPVQVFNRGLLGDIPSNPNAVLLAKAKLSDSTEPVGAVVLDTGEVAVANYGDKTIAFFDGETLAGPSKTLPTSNQPEGLAYGAGKLWYPNNSRLMVVRDPLGAATTALLDLEDDFLALDVDDDFGTLLVALDGSYYQTVDLVTEAVSAAVKLTGVGSFGIQAAGLDGSRGLAVFPRESGTTQVVPLGAATASYTASGNGYAVAVDRGAGIGWVGGPTSLKRVALSPGSTLSPVAVPLPMRLLRHNSLSRRIVAAPSGETDLSYSVGLVDAEAASLDGYLGTGAQRGCGPGLGSFRPEGLALDPTHNRAYVTSSCDDTVESYNLNVLMAVLPAPAIASFSPASHATGNGSFTLKVLGTGFHPTAKVTYAGTAVTPTSLTPTEITFTAPASSCGGSKIVAVTNTDPARWAASKAYSITMGTPTLNSASLGSACTCTNGACASCTVTVTGSGFTSGCSVVHVGTASATGSGSSSSLSASFSLCAGAAGSTTQCGAQSLAVNVSNPGGGTSGSVYLTY